VTHTYKKRPTCMKRDLHSNIRPLMKSRILMKRDLYIWKVTHTYEKRPTCMKETYIQTFDHWWKAAHGWKDTYIYEKWRIYMKRDLHVWKETYIQTFDHACQSRTFMKRNLNRCKVTHIYEKRSKNMKRDLHVWKETYIQIFAHLCIASHLSHSAHIQGGENS